jgi:hypothetical protein
MPFLRNFAPATTGLTASVLSLRGLRRVTTPRTGECSDPHNSDSIAICWIALA